MLEVRHLRSGYDRLPVLQGISFDLAPGEWLTVVGANGAGKTTLLWAISGLLPREGTIRFEGRDLSRARPKTIVEAGVVHVPQGRQLFGELSVRDNLLLGAYARRSRTHKEEVHKDLDAMLALFPEIAARLDQQAGTLSGGEQQMVAIGRGLMASPKLLMLDEPSTGLAPILVRRIFEALDALHEEGIAILLVEQDAQLALEHADRGCVLRAGEVALEGRGPDLAESEEVREIYFGKRVRRPGTPDLGGSTGEDA